MSESQAKRKRQEEQQQQPNLEATIILKRDVEGHVRASGNINNPIATFDILGKGCLALASFYAQAAQEKASKIIKPDSKTMGSLLGGK